MHEIKICKPQFLYPVISAYGVMCPWTLCKKNYDGVMLVSSICNALVDINNVTFSNHMCYRDVKMASWDAHWLGAISARSNRWRVSMSRSGLACGPAPSYMWVHQGIVHCTSVLHSIYLINGQKSYISHNRAYCTSCLTPFSTCQKKFFSTIQTTENQTLKTILQSNLSIVVTQGTEPNWPL